MKKSIGRELFQKVSYLLLILIFMVNIAYSQEYKVRIAMIGNSITYGTGLSNPAEESYSSQLGLMLAEIYGDTCQIENYGVSGLTMMRSSENPFWNAPQFLNALKYVPDICLILLGTNDSKPYRWDTWGDEFLIDYLAMIDTFKYRNPNTLFIVCYPPPIWEGHAYGTNFSNSHNDSVLVNNINPAIDSVVEKTGAILVDFHAPFVDSLNLFPDKLHPNAQGHMHMAEIVYDKIIETDLIHQVEAGLAYVSSFGQSVTPVAVGNTVDLSWATIFADSVFLDGIAVETSGSMEVIAEQNRVYILTAKGSENTSEFPLPLKTYIAEKSSMYISTSSTDYSMGSPVELYAYYEDQYGRKIRVDTVGITWSIIQGEGIFGEQSDTSIVLIPGGVGNIIVEAGDGELTVQKTFKVNTFESSLWTSAIEEINVFPNPVNETLNIQLVNLNSDNSQIKVFNMLGEQFLDQSYRTASLTSSVLKINTSNLPEGVYIYVIYINNMPRTGQFVKLVDRF